MTDFRAMCAELLAWAERTSSHYYKQADVIVRARALLAQPVAEGPTVDRLLDLQDRIQMGSLTLAEALEEIAGPKPPSLKEQALAELEILSDYAHGLGCSESAIRRALEALPE
jgi:hypothetical protein